MNRNSFWAASGKALAVLAFMFMLIFILAPSARAQATEKVLYSFTGGKDGADPHQGLIFDQAGNVYGTTFDHGLHRSGNIYTLIPNADGTWTQSVLYSFKGGGDGGAVDWGRLTFDATGNLYGATYAGGRRAGTIFQVTPNGDGTWTENVLHRFTGGKDGAQPRTVPYFDAQGNMYGTAAYGGAYGCGTAFELTPGPDNQWTYHVIHQFKGTGCSPWVGLIPDQAGNLYGTTRNDVGGCSNPPTNCGTVFQLTPTTGGKWTYKVIHKFKGGKGGSDPSVSGLIFDDTGTLYGSTQAQGVHNSGLFFKLTLGANDKWQYSVLHQFKKKADGIYPDGQFARDASGNIYGTTGAGGPYGGGTLYKMTPNPDGTWTFIVIWAFGAGNDGVSPMGGPVLDAAGNLYGTTVVGGDYGYGTIYEITP